MSTTPLSTTPASARSFLASVLALSLAACASGTGGTPPTGAPTASAETAGTAAPPEPDPRIGLEAGRFDAGTAAWNMRLVSTTATPEPYRSATHSDLAFRGDLVIQGNYAGILIWDVSDPAEPRLRARIHCPASQNDVSVHGNLLFVSTEGLNSRVDCGDQGVEESVSEERMRGVRNFDVGYLDAPELVSNVQT